MNVCSRAALVMLALGNMLPASAETAAAPSAFGGRGDSAVSPKLPVQPLVPLVPFMPSVPSVPAVRAVPPATAFDTKKPSFLAPVASGSAGNGAFDAKADKSRANLFDMDDRAIIIVSGRQSTAGALKKSILAEIDKHNGPAQRISAARKAATLDVHPEHREAAPPAAVNPAVIGQAKLRAERMAAGTSGVPVLSTRSQTLMPDPTQIPTIPPPPLARGSFAERVDHSKTEAILEITCADKGPPTIAEVKGTLKPGQAVLLQGRCFGNRAGQIAIASQYFPGGKLRVAPLVWDMNEIRLVVPDNIVGVPDHSVYITAATAEGRTSSPQPARFVALREHVNVPTRLWLPTSRHSAADSMSFKKPAAEITVWNSLRDSQHTHGRDGRTNFQIQVNEACALDTVDVDVRRGSVRSLSGWEAGPPHRAEATVDWRSSCVEIDVHNNYVFDVSWDLTIACGIDFQLKATADCPAGIPIDHVSLKDQGAPARLR